MVALFLEHLEGLAKRLLAGVYSALPLQLRQIVKQLSQQGTRRESQMFHEVMAVYQRWLLLSGLQFLVIEIKPPAYSLLQRKHLSAQ